MLLGELRRPYADVLSEAIASQVDLAELEMNALGFDHRQLTSALLRQWNLPPLLTAAIGAAYDTRYWARNKADHAHLVRVLHLAELFAQLIGQRRLSVLPDLLDAGDAYCQLDKAKLNDVIATLEPKVRQLATVLSLQIAGGEDYTQIIVQAHAKMSQVAEGVAAPLSRGIANDAASPIESELQEAHAMILARQLRASFEQFYRGGGDAFATSPSVEARHAPANVANRFAVASSELSAVDDLETRLTIEVGRCRSLRRPIGVAIVEVQLTELLDATQADLIERLLDRACKRAEGAKAIERLGVRRRLLLLPGRDRHEAVISARQAVDEVRGLLDPFVRAEQLPPLATGAGVASAATPAKNFRAVSLLETADRCLAAALRSGGVKSLEVS